MPRSRTSPHMLDILLVCGPNCKEAADHHKQGIEIECLVSVLGLI